MKLKKNTIFGIRPVIEAINDNKQIDKLLIQNGLKGELFIELKTLLKERNIHFQSVPVEKLNRISRKNHQGVIGFLAPISFQNIEDIVPLIYENGQTPFILILDRITDVRNFGAIVRTAECAGVHAIVLPEKERAMITPDAVKTSAGAIFKIPICISNSLKKSVTFLQDSGIKVTACTEKASSFHFKESYTTPTAIIMGSEENGIHNELLKKADSLAKIPMNGKIGSLNVSVALGIIAYEVIRQRSI